MKKAFSILLVLSLVVMVVACASKPAPAAPAPVSVQVNSPAWINDFPPEDVLWGIGIAKMADPAMGMMTAEERGRVAIARQLNSKVQAMFTDYNLAAGSAGNQATASMQESVSRSVTNMDVSGARPIKREQMPDGTWWYLVEMKKADAKSQVANILGNQEAAFAQFKAQQALDMLDAQLSKQESPARVDS